MHRLYKKGAYAALADLGFKLAEEYDEEEQGTPFPEKSKTIGAERLADMLRQNDSDDEGSEIIAPENPSYTWDRPVTWQSPINVSGFQGGGGVGGLFLPGSARS